MKIQLQLVAFIVFLQISNEVVLDNRSLVHISLVDRHGKFWTDFKKTYLLVHFGLVFVHPYYENGYQSWKLSTMSTKYNPKDKENFIKTLQTGVSESQYIFNNMKNELRRARNINIQKRSPFIEKVMSKRETNDLHNHNQTTVASSPLVSSNKDDSSSSDSSDEEWREEWYNQAQQTLREVEETMKEVDKLLEQADVLEFQAQQKIWKSENFPDNKAAAIREAEVFQVQADEKRRLANEKKKEAQDLRQEADMILEKVRSGHWSKEKLDMSVK